MVVGPGPTTEVEATQHLPESRLDGRPPNCGENLGKKGWRPRVTKIFVAAPSSNKVSLPSDTVLRIFELSAPLLPHQQQQPSHHAGVMVHADTAVHRPAQAAHLNAEADTCRYKGTAGGPCWGGAVAQRHRAAEGLPAHHG